MQTHDFYYDLPKELIAQTPIEPRDHSRLLVYHKDSKQIEHKHFYDIVDYLKAGDVLVINDTKVYPARIYGTRLGENVTKELNTEVLLLKRQDYLTWECITRPAKKLKIGTKIKFSDELVGEVVGFADEGIRYIKFEFEGIFEDILDRIGQMPLPPYITKKLEDKTRYNTVYAEHLGSAAAPTAGLHFTKELLQKVQDMGVTIAHVTLDVGLGTFRPVKEDDILKHKMHTESYEITKENADIINKAKDEKRRVICVGTTSVRVVESIADETGHVRPFKGDTNIFIYPGYKFKVVDGLITNFHLPESTLIMLVSAFLGREETLDMYKVAVEEKYRFFSFGDATLLI
ncbi:MAG: tRNA preQ1(34) S-adenosylmethionine ribosyltransferase-isomerase QueA [Clostridiales bacterium]|nr:tRNA preQ1(34) S-adenosylmethionine ribosyltransferase-isomerase QueA [Clostridiales bacterium]